MADGIAIPRVQPVGNIIAGVTELGNAVKVLVDDTGALISSEQVADESPAWALQLIFEMRELRRVFCDWNDLPFVEGPDVDGTE